jgi:hypothetical protein
VHKGDNSREERGSDLRVIASDDRVSFFRLKLLSTVMCTCAYSQRASRSFGSWPLRRSPWVGSPPSTGSDTQNVWLRANSQIAQNTETRYSCAGYALHPRRFEEKIGCVTRQERHTIYTPRSVYSRAELDHAMRQEPVVASVLCCQPTLPPHHAAGSSEHDDGHAA